MDVTENEAREAVAEGAEQRRSKVSGYWGDGDFTGNLARIHWMASAVVRIYLNQLASGVPTRDWLRTALCHPLTRGGELRQRAEGEGWRVLVLGCGTGWLERAIAGRPEIHRIDACDISEAAVAEAAAEARRLGLEETLRYHVVDLNEEPPPGGPYDVIIAHSVLHHVENLEYAYPRLARALAPHGMLVVNEYVGPRRFQFSDEQMAVINGALARLPERYRRSVMMAGAVYPHKEVPTVEQMIATDPSESVRSDELLAFTHRHFDVREERVYGGTVLQHLLYDVIHNFVPGDAGDARLVGLLCLLEEALIREGALPSDYALQIARAKPGAEVDAAGVEVGEAERGALWPAPPQPPARAVRVTPELLLRDQDAAQVPEPGAAPRRTIHSRPVRDIRHGLDLGPVRRHVHRLATGDPGCDWVSWVLGTALGNLGAMAPGVARLAVPEGGRALVLGGPGGERRDAVRLMEAVSASPTISPRIAGIDLLAVDVVEAGRWRWALHAGGPEGPVAGRWEGDRLPELEAGAYGLVWTNGFLGRVPDRRGLASRLAAALTPGGLLVGDEWIGPTDGRTDPRTLHYARQVATLLQPLGAPGAGLKERLRERLVDFEHGWVRHRFGPPERGLGEILGPSLELVMERPTGGALLQRVLAPGLEAELFAAGGGDGEARGDGEAEAERGRQARDAFAALAAYLEELLTEAGTLADEYACFIARRR